MVPLPNTQPREKQRLREDGVLEVVQVFHTIQGEGPFAGLPAVFVRLAGCNLQCPLCDTDYTSNRQELSPFEVREAVRVAVPAFGRTDLVVLTGGEPFRQNIAPAVREFMLSGWRVQIETNGTLYVDDFPWASPLLTVVCSPKTPVIEPKMVPRINAWKYVVQAGKVESYDGLPSVALGGQKPARPPRDFPRDQIYLQPCDEQDEAKNKANLNTARDSALKWGYRVGVQLHKILGVP